MKRPFKFVFFLLLLSLVADAEIGIGWISSANMLALELPLTPRYGLCLSGTFDRYASPNVYVNKNQRQEDNTKYLSCGSNLDLLRSFSLYNSPENRFILKTSPFVRLTYGYRREISENRYFTTNPNDGQNSSSQDTKRLNEGGIALGIRPEFRIFDRMSLFMTAGFRCSYIYEVLSETAKIQDHRFDAGIFEQGFSLTSVSLMVWLR